MQLIIAKIEIPNPYFYDLHLSISNGFVSFKTYDKRGGFDLDIIDFPVLDGHVPRAPSYGVYNAQLIRFARVSNHLVDFDARNKSFTAKLLQNRYLYYTLSKIFFLSLSLTLRIGL